MEGKCFTCKISLKKELTDFVCFPMECKISESEYTVKQVLQKFHIWLHDTCENDRVCGQCYNKLTVLVLKFQELTEKAYETHYTDVRKPKKTSNKLCANCLTPFNRKINRKLNLHSKPKCSDITVKEILEKLCILKSCDDKDQICETCYRRLLNLYKKLKKFSSAFEKNSVRIERYPLRSDENKIQRYNIVLSRESLEKGSKLFDGEHHYVQTFHEEPDLKLQVFFEFIGLKDNSVKIKIGELKVEHGEKRNLKGAKCTDFEENVENEYFEDVGHNNSLKLHENNLNLTGTKRTAFEENVENEYFEDVGHNNLLKLHENNLNLTGTKHTSAFEENDENEYFEDVGHNNTLKLQRKTSHTDSKDKTIFNAVKESKLLQSIKYEEFAEDMKIAPNIYSRQSEFSDKNTFPVLEKQDILWLDEQGKSDDESDTADIYCDEDFHNDDSKNYSKDSDDSDHNKSSQLKRKTVKDLKHFTFSKRKQDQKTRRKHLKSNNIVKCNECDFTTSHQQYIDRHIRCKHPESWKTDIKSDPQYKFDPVYCKFCGSKLLHVASLYRHVRKQHATCLGYEDEMARLEQERRCKCPYCPTTVTRFSHLRRHIADIHDYDGNAIKCERCGIMLKNKACYQNHIKYSHEQTQKTWLCTICGQMFKMNAHLTDHIKSVHGTEKFKCDMEGCDFVSNCRRYLQKHKKFKHGEATFMCAICARKFKCIQRLRMHNQLIHQTANIEKHKCPKCGKEFNLKSNMKKHIDGVHNKVWKMRCNYCEKGFFSSKLLQQHVAKNHSISVEEKELSKDLKCKSNSHVVNEANKSMLEMTEYTSHVIDQNNYQTFHKVSTVSSAQLSPLITNIYRAISIPQDKDTGHSIAENGEFINKFNLYDYQHQLQLSGKNNEVDESIRSPYSHQGIPITVTENEETGRNLNSVTFQQDEQASGWQWEKDSGNT